MDKPSYYITYCFGSELTLVIGHSVTDVLAVHHVTNEKSAQRDANTAHWL